MLYEKKFWVYILLCKGDRFYTGSTNDLERRYKEHCTRKGGYFTRAFPPLKMVYSEEFNTRSEAMKREREIKRMSHNRKSSLGDMWLVKQS